MTPSLYAIARWNLRAALRWWQPLVTVALFGLLGWWGAAQALVGMPLESARAVTVWDGFFVAWAGPSVEGFSLLTLLFWFVPQLLFFFMVGNLANGELAQRGYAIVPRVGARARWWWSKIALLGMLACAYPLLAVSATLIGATLVAPFSWQNSVAQLLDLPREISSTALLVWAVLLFSSTIFAFAVWQTIVALLFRQSFYGLIMVIVVILVSALLGTNNSQLVRWLPGAQSMLLRHSFLDSSVPWFPLQWSLLYNTVSLLVALAAGRWYVIRLDIVGSLSNEQ